MNIRKQQGMSIVGFVLVLSLVLFFSFVAIKIGPIYVEFFSVTSAMKGVASERGSAQYSTRIAQRKVFARLYVSYAEGNIKPENIKVIRKSGAQLHIKYEVRKNLIGNLDVVAKFDRMERLST